MWSTSKRSHVYQRQKMARFQTKGGDVLEVRFTSSEAEIEAVAVAFLFFGVLEDGLVEGRYLGTSHEELKDYQFTFAARCPTPRRTRSWRHSKLVAKSLGKEENEKGWKGYYNKDWRQDS